MTSLAVVARPYARAVFELACEADALARWGDGLAFAACAVSVPEVQELLTDPRIQPGQLAEAIHDAGGERMDKEFGHFLHVLAANGRLGALPEIAASYAQLRAEAERSLNVTVQSAVELEAAQRRKLEHALSQRFQRSIAADYQTDATLLGGVVVRAGDTVIDGSLRNQLERLASALQNA